MVNVAYAPMRNPLSMEVGGKIIELTGNRFWWEWKASSICFVVFPVKTIHLQVEGTLMVGYTDT